VPCAKLAVQVVGQLIPAGLLVIVPAPAAGAVTVNWKDGVVAVVGGDPRPAQPIINRADTAQNIVNPNDDRCPTARTSSGLGFR
jgi:hypothetical protein